jgi:hypothetical protein
MAADPRQVLRILDYRGIDVRVDDNRLIAKPRQGEIPDDMIRFIRHYRDLIVDQLHSQERGAA